MNVIISSVLLLIRFLKYVIFFRCILSWIPQAMDSKLYYMMYRVTAPIEDPIRNLTNRYINAPVDLSPLIAYFALNLLSTVIITMAY